MDPVEIFRNNPMKYILLLIMTAFAWGQPGMNVISRPSGANVFLDGVAIGTTPINNGSISIGKHLILLKKEGYAQLEYNFDVSPAKSLGLDFQLNRLFAVTIVTKETGLKFQLNDDYSWTGKKEKFLMEEGDHILKVFEADSLMETRNFTINQATEINFEFK